VHCPDARTSPAPPAAASNIAARASLHEHWPSRTAPSATPPGCPGRSLTATATSGVGVAVACKLHPRSARPPSCGEWRLSSRLGQHAFRSMPSVGRQPPAGLRGMVGLSRCLPCFGPQLELLEHVLHWLHEVRTQSFPSPGLKPRRIRPAPISNTSCASRRPCGSGPPISR